MRTAIFFPCSMYVLRSACIVYPLHGSCFVSGVVELQHLSRVHSTLLSKHEGGMQNHLIGVTVLKVEHGGIDKNIVTSNMGRL